VKRLATTEGQLVPSGDTLRFDYSLKDHLGNVRVVFSEKGDILQKNDYYPFGLEIDRNAPVQTPAARNGVNRYKFLGKETQVATGYIDLSRRFYDPAIGRFMQGDPVTELQENHSVYQYGWNNPILRSDPNGDCPDCPDNGMSFVENVYYDMRDRASSGAYTVGTYIGSLFSDNVKVEKINATYGENGRQLETAQVEGNKHVAAALGVLDVASAVPSSNIAGSLMAKVVGAKSVINEVVSSTVKDISRKLKGALTEPTLPPKTLASKDGIDIVHYTKSGDHGPPHVHVKGGGAETRIGQNGKPLKNNPSLTTDQQSVVNDYKKDIKNAVKKIGAWFNYNQQ